MKQPPRFDSDDQQQHEMDSSAVWNALQKLQDNLVSTPTKRHRRYRPLRRAATKRRALLEHSLKSHYHAHQHHHNLHTSAGDSSWGHGPCVYFNERKSSYWTYQYCNTQKVVQAHWIATSLQGDYRPEVSHNLGVAVTTVPSSEEATFWREMIHSESVESFEYFQDGDVCLVENEDSSSASTTTVKRKTLVLKNPEPQCGRPTHVWHEWRIVAVTEPSPCHYIFYVCGPSKDKQQEQEQQQESPNKANSEEVPPVTTDLPVLQAYLHEVDVVDPITSTNDRTISWHSALPPLPTSRVAANKQLIHDMFTHAYDSYMYNAFPSPEIQPLTCTPGTFSLVKLPALTLIDALDTLLIMGNATEFARSVERLRGLAAPYNHTLFAVNQNVSLFETNIRVLGGLLSAHQLAEAYINDGTVLLSQVFDKSGKVKFGDDEIVEDDAREGEKGDALSKETATAPKEEPRTEDEEEKEEPTIEEQEESACKGTQEEECVAKDLVCEDTDKKKQNSTKASSLPYWSYDGLLLELAHDLGTRLLPAFNTKTGIPYGTVNLLYGIPHGETTVASLAGGGTLSLEMELLSRLTGDESFGKAAKLASRALWLRRSPQHDLLGKHIEITKGDWTETLSGIGSNSDSFYEYLIKHYALFPEDADFWTMFVAVYNGVYNGTRTGEWYADVDMSLGTKHGASRRVFESLQAFYPGMQALVGELGPAARSLNSFFLVREYLGFLPERFNYGSWKVDGGPHGAGLHPLRPELLESCYFLHQATKTGINSTQSSGWLWAADFALHTLNELTDTPCGYATVKNLSPKTTGAVPPENSEGIKLVNEMPSFFLSETLKYLYLTFDDDNILHQDDEREWIFTTEAHPFHHVPKKSPEAVKSKPKSELDSKKQKVKDMLLVRKSKTFNKNRNKRKAPPSKTAILMNEMWSANTHLASHINGLRECDSDTMVRKLDIKDHHLFRQYLQPELTDEVNLAYTSYGDAGMGDGSSLRKSCPNFHRSSLQWIRALNGGVLDYSDVYLSSLSDSLFSEQIPIAVSAADALASHGSGMFLDKYPLPPSCSTSTGLAATEEVVNPEAAPVEKDSGPLVQRFDMGGDEGEFEISAFPEGFMIERVQSGEIIVTTVLMNEVKNGPVGKEVAPNNPFVMTYSIRPLQHSGSSVEIPPKRWTGASLRSFFGRNKHPSSLPAVERSVVVTNARHNAFRCEVQLFSSVDENAEGEEELLMVYPCAPALFGPSKLTRLIQLGEVQVGGNVRLPDPSDEAGCSEGDSYAPTTIQIVRRGTCTFQAKAINQNLRSGAEAVIVINSAPDELFVMAEGGVDIDEKAAKESPLTVMVTKNDGEIISAAIKQGMATTARVQLVPHKGEVNTNGEVVGAVDWPIVRATSESLVQVFSENGWGVHAVNRPKENQDGQEWQLFLMKHTLNQSRD